MTTVYLLCCQMIIMTSKKKVAGKMMITAKICLTIVANHGLYEER